MPTGGCQCGAVRYEFEGDPLAVALCHCIPCRRSSNSTHSTNIMLPLAAFKPSGTPKTYQRTGDSGKLVTNHFCAECGTLVYVKGEAFATAAIVKAGTLDDLGLNDTTYKPTLELYTRNKYGWMPKFDGVAEFAGSAGGA